jgi:predicted DNA-binding transcriptional regulator AlpA
MNGDSVPWRYQSASMMSSVSDLPPLRTGDLAKRLGVSRSTLGKWHRAGWISPEMVTAGGEPRWVEADVRAQLKALNDARRSAVDAEPAQGTPDDR